MKKYVSILTFLGLLTVTSMAHGYALPDPDGSLAKHFEKNILAHSNQVVEEMFGPYLEENSVHAVGYQKKITTDEKEAIAWFTTAAENEVAREWQQMYSDMYPAFYISSTFANAEYVGSEPTTITKPDGSVAPRTKYKYRVKPMYMDLWNPYKDKIVTPKPPIVEAVEPFEEGMIIQVKGVGYTESSLDVDSKSRIAVNEAKTAACQKVIDIALEQGLITTGQTDALRQYITTQYKYGGIYDVVGFGVIGTRSITVYIDKQGTWEDFRGDHVRRYKEMKAKEGGQETYKADPIEKLIDVKML